MTTSLVHIGFHKTGTTWFQRRFYPQVTSHRYIEQHKIITAFAKASLTDLDTAALRAALGIVEDRPVILCDESLCGNIRESGMHGRAALPYAALLKQLVPDAAIVVFVRRQTETLASLYGEFVRGGMTRSARDFVNPAYDDRVPPLTRGRWSRTHLVQLEYDRLIAHYDSVFGRERVHVYAYEQFCGNSAEVLADLARRFGLHCDRPVQAEVVENRAYRHWLLPLARAFNRFGRGTTYDDPVWIDLPGWYALSRGLLHRLNRLPLPGRAPTPSELFGADLVNEFDRRYAVSNQRLKALRPDLPLAELGYPL